MIRNICSSFASRGLASFAEFCLFNYLVWPQLQWFYYILLLVMYCKGLAFETKLENKTVQVLPLIHSNPSIGGLLSSSLFHNELDHKLGRHFILLWSDMTCNTDYIFCLSKNIFPSPRSGKVQKVQWELTWEDSHWAGPFDWQTILEPGDGRKRDARSLTAQSNWVLHYNTHIFWKLYLTNDTRWDWTKGRT